MMSVFLSSFLIIFFAKDNFFFSEFFFLEKNCSSLLFIFPLVLFIILQCSFSSLGKETRLFYNFIFSSLLFFLSFCFCSTFSFFFLLFLESCVFLMILLIFSFSKDLDKFSSVSFMFLINILGSIPFMYFCFSHESFFLVSQNFLGGLSSFWLIFSCYFILLSKVPIYFLHFWLTKAHVSASGSGSMILASLMLKIGTLGIFKFCFIFLSFIKKLLFSYLCSICVSGCILLSLIMIRFFDVKYLVACSSIVHMSLIMPGTILPNPLGITASFLMMVGHGLISCLVFFLVTLMYELSLNRSSDSGKSIESSDKFLSLFFFTFFLFNMGFPPLISFLSEFLFISMFLKISLFFLILFSLSLMFVGLVFMLISLLFLFGKFSKKNSSFSSSILSSIFPFFLLFLLFLPFTFF